MNATNTTFLIISSILVFFMTPGLAFFYGGLVSKKNVVNTMLSVFVICGIAVLLFILVGFELCFKGDIGGLIGRVSSLGLAGINLNAAWTNGISTSMYLIFQMMFAIITPALFVGAVVGRMRFNFFVVFVIVWSLLVYYPMVHLVWSSNGLLASLGVLDFAGGTVVHINAGITALLLSIFLGRRLKDNQKPVHYNLPWVLLGTSILWIGWYGFNAGSALAMDNIALNAFLTTTVATAAAMVTWMLLDMHKTGKPTLVGVCTGALCGLVGVTPACGYVDVLGALLIGIVCALASFWFVGTVKPKLKYDDPLDAFGCHGISGIVGSILTGVFATKSINSGIAENGLFYGGGWHLLGVQLLGTAATIIFVSVVVSLALYVLKHLIKMRVDMTEEISGLDEGEHGEYVDYTATMPAKDVERYSGEFKGQLAHLNHPGRH